jgi:hypothetical protein
MKTMGSGVMAPEDPEHAGSQLFTVRLWTEDTGEGTEYRGQVRHVLSGSTRHFRRWEELAACLASVLEEARQGGGREKVADPGVPGALAAGHARTSTLASRAGSGPRRQRHPG